MGYENGKSLCLLQSLRETIFFVCKESLDEYKDKQSKIIFDLNFPTNTHINVFKEKGIFAAINVYEFGGMGGYYSIIKNIDGEWKNIYSG